MLSALSLDFFWNRHLLLIVIPYHSLFLVFSSFSIYRVNTSEKIMIIAELLHHVSSSIRQSALNTLQCVIESCENQVCDLFSLSR